MLWASLKKINLCRWKGRRPTLLIPLQMGRATVFENSPGLPSFFLAPADVGNVDRLATWCAIVTATISIGERTRASAVSGSPGGYSKCVTEGNSYNSGPVTEGKFETEKRKNSCPGEHGSPILPCRFRRIILLPSHRRAYNIFLHLVRFDSWRLYDLV